MAKIGEFVHWSTVFQGRYTGSSVVISNLVLNTSNLTRFRKSCTLAINVIAILISLCMIFIGVRKNFNKIQLFWKIFHFWIPKAKTGPVSAVNVRPWFSSIKKSPPGRLSKPHQFSSKSHSKTFLLFSISKTFLTFDFYRKNSPIYSENYKK